jgi:hypothetical protein
MGNDTLDRHAGAKPAGMAARAALRREQLQLRALNRRPLEMRDGESRAFLVEV